MAGKRGTKSGTWLVNLHPAASYKRLITNIIKLLTR